MLIIKISGSGGGAWTDHLLSAIEYGIEHGVHLFNLSMGTDLYYSALEEAIRYAHNNSKLIVIAAGNNGQEGSVDYPARFYAEGTFSGFENGYGNVISVGNTGHDDLRWITSSWGEGLVSVAAPAGEGIPIDDDPLPPPDLNDPKPSAISTFSGDFFGLYQYTAGTSSATAHVSGLAGLLLSYNPSLSFSELRFIIENSADKVGGYTYSNDKGTSLEIGHGRLNAYWALRSLIFGWNDDCGFPWDPVARKPMEPHRYQGTDFNG